VRIAHVVNVYDGDRLYQEGHLARHQADEGHTVTVIALLARGAPPTAIRLRILPSRQFARWSFPHVVSFWRVLGASNVEVVHVHNLTTPLPILAVLIAGLKRKAVVVDSHMSVENLEQRLVSPRLKAFAFRWLVAPVVKRFVWKFVAVASPEREFLSTLLGVPLDEIPLIPLGADTDVFRPRQELRAAVREELGIAQSDLCLTHVGRLTEAKGVATVIRVARKSGCRVLLVGEAEPALRSVIAEGTVEGTVIARHSTSKPRLAELLAATDIALWPAKPSVSLLEVVAAGVPAITRDSPHYREIFGSAGVYGEGEDDFVSVVASLARDEQARQDMSDAQRDVIRGRYEWPVVGRRFDEVYRGAVEYQRSRALRCRA
jgi:glycosyltransferase involved in cell wall biosynthesis